jgi:hypothetical protein
MESDRLASFEQRLQLSEQALHDMTVEIARLHSQRRRWTPAGAALALILTVFLVSEQSPATYAQAPQGMTVKAPFIVLDDAGRPLMAVLNDLARGVKIFDATGEVVAELNDSGLGSGALRVHSRTFKNGAALTADSQGGSLQLETTGRTLAAINAKTTAIGAPFRVNSNNGTPLIDVTTQSVVMKTALRVQTAAGAEVASMTENGYGGGTLTVGSGKIPAAMLGTGQSGAGFLLVRNKEGVDAAAVGAPGGRPAGFYAFGSDGKTIQASLGLDDTLKGILRVGDSNSARGVLGHTKAGGVSFALYDAAGDAYRVGLLAAPDNSFVRLNSQKHAVHLNADGTGAAVHLFNTAGSAAASLQSTSSGFGKFSLGNPAGDTMVEAGTTNGVGIVRAGPMIGGPAKYGLTGLPYAIIGTVK